MTELTYTEEIVPIEKLREDEEFRSLVPPNNMKEQLVSSITKNGQTLPIDVDAEYIILDGYTRVSIFRELKYNEVKVRKWNFKSSEDRVTAYKLIAMLNLQRRHLEKNEVLRLIREVAEKIEKLSKQNKSQNFEQIPTQVDRNLEMQNEKNTLTSQSILESNTETNTKISYNTLKKAREEIGAKDVSEWDLQTYSSISEFPWLRQLVDDSKISLKTAYDLYRKAKDKLQKISSLPKYEREQLLTTKEGRKIVLERDDLLQLILDHKMAVSQAINKIKTEEKLARSKKSSKPRAKEEEEDAETDEEEEIESEGEQREDSESDEYPFVEDWERINKEEKEKQLTPQFNGQVLVKQEISESKGQIDFLNDLMTKGYSELPFEIALVKIEGKCYAVNVGALYDLEQGLPEKWKDLEAFLNKYGIIIPDEVEGLYVIPWKLLGRCSEWK
ncbi:ParB N-terminal domain-containing protein [Saccharolobus islandicus]|uniref:ParB domain protein nuclease n=1 Tax=Saccharolobus islandicus (strain M.16.27) TaxID=427318 RepID=C3N600_SACI3|nr:ParB N-terminal domain-containing protein [Sulfolobus islandicus]ACP55425.1 ParB domain protein nuclease [Sulfolobus islandicus M.16.27]